MKIFYPLVISILEYTDWKWQVYEREHPDLILSFGNAETPELALKAGLEARDRFLHREAAYQEAITRLRMEGENTAARALIENGRRQNYRLD